MINRDWERFGEEIRRTVQDAIDAQDFNKLNQTVTDTINSAVDGIARTIKNAGNTGSSGSGRAQSHQYYRQVPPKPQQGGETYSQSYYSPLKKVVPRNVPNLYRSVTSVMAGGTVMAALGGAFGGICFLFLIFSVLSMVFGDGIGLPGMIAVSTFLIFSAGGLVLNRWGSVLRGRVKRFRAYIRILGRREYCNIRELAEGTNKNMKYVLKDLQQMLGRGWFLQGHLDEQKTCLIVSHGMYQEYLKLENERRQNSIEAERVKELKNHEEQKKPEKQGQKLSPEVKRIVEEGDAYIRKIHACNDAIPGEEISAKISRMETVIDRIFDRIEQNPESVDDIRRLMDYYLPTTIKLLEAYQELDSQPVGGANIQSSKEEIEKTLDTLSGAFEKLLDDLFQDTAWDVSSDISVLRTMLAQDGLTEDELRK